MTPSSNWISGLQKQSCPHEWTSASGMVNISWLSLGYSRVSRTRSAAIAKIVSNRMQMMAIEKTSNSPATAHHRLHLR